MKQLPLHCLFFSLCSMALADTPVLNPEGERIMEALLSDGTVVDSQLVIYQSSNDWLLPLSQLSEDLSLAISVSTALALADGFVVSEKRQFRLDTKQCFVSYESRNRESYLCSQVVIHHDEIYVSRKLLEKWLPLDLSVDPLRAQVLISPREKLPLQLKKERQELAERSQGLMSDYDPGYERQKEEYSLFDGGPFIDEQIGITNASNAMPGQSLLQHSTQISGQLVGLDAMGTVIGSERSIDSWRINMSRKSPTGKIMGPLHLTNVELWDVYLPPLPLITDSQPGHGFLFSSYPLETPTTFEKQDLTGLLQPGWEVLLYRNDVLMDRQVGNATGRYFFKGVGLLYGRNLFRLSFFGPHGERRNEYKTYNIDPSLNRAGRNDYRFGIATLANTRQQMNFQFSQSLGNLLTANSGVLYNQGTNEHYGYLGITGINELFLFNTNCAFATRGGKACEWGQQFGVGTVTVGTKYARLLDFRSALLNNVPGENLISQITANVGYLIPFSPGIVMTWALIKNNFEGNTSRTLLRNLSGSIFGDLQINNEIDFDLGLTSPFNGRLSLFYFPSMMYRFRTGIEYSGLSLSTVEEEFRLVAENSYSTGVVGSYHFLEHAPGIGLTAARLFKEASIGIGVATHNFKDISANVLASFSLARDGRTSDWYLSRDPAADYGAASVLVFLDRNRNGEKDPDEPTFSNISVIINQREVEFKTNEKGIVFIPSLRPYSNVDLSISHRSLQDPFIQPAKRGVRFVAIPGKTTHINLPLVVVGEIDGAVSQVTGDSTDPKRGVPIELLDSFSKSVQTVKTDSEGYYVFENVSPGKYSIRILPSKLESSKWHSVPVLRKTEIGPEGSFESGQDFSIAGD